MFLSKNGKNFHNFSFERQKSNKIKKEKNNFAKTNFFSNLKSSSEKIQKEFSKHTGRIGFSHRQSKSHANTQM